MFHKVI